MRTDGRSLFCASQVGLLIVMVVYLSTYIPTTGAEATGGCSTQMTKAFLMWCGMVKKRSVRSIPDVPDVDLPLVDVIDWDLYNGGEHWPSQQEQLLLNSLDHLQTLQNKHQTETKRHYGLKLNGMYIIFAQW